MSFLAWQTNRQIRIFNGNNPTTVKPRAYNKLSSRCMEIICKDKCIIFKLDIRKYGKYISLTFGNVGHYLREVTRTRTIWSSSKYA